MSNTRFQFDLSDSRVAEIRQLMEDCGITTNKELFNNALTLLQWAVGEVKKGNVIGSLNEQEQRYRELHMPVLLHAGSAAKKEKAVDTKDNSY